MGAEYRHNKDLAEYQANLQSQENQRQEQWNADEWDRQNEINMQNWFTQFNAQSEYNSEQAKAERLRSVGVNPIHALSGQPSQNVVGGSMPSPSVSPRSGVSPAPAPYGTSNALPNLLNNINEAVANMYKGGLAQSQKNQIDALLSGQVKNQLLTIQNQELQNRFQSVANIIQEASAPARVKREFADLMNTIADTALKESQKVDFDKAAFMKQTQAELNKFCEEKGRLLLPYEKLKLKTEAQLLPGLIASEIESNRAAANRDNEVARGQGLYNDINLENKSGLVSMMQDEIQRSLDQNRITRATAASLEYAAQQAEYANDQKVLLFWKDFVVDCLHEGVGVFEAFTKLKSAKAFETMSEADKRSVEQHERELKAKYNSVEREVTYEHANGHRSPIRSTERYNYVPDSRSSNY